MTDWPPIDEPRTRRRLAMDDDEFAELALRLAQRIGGEPFTERHFEHAIGYPWHPMQGGAEFALRADGSAPPLGNEDRERAREMSGNGGLHPMVAIGSNASPDALARKLADLADPLDREVLAASATLNDVKIGFSAHIAVYGALPATLVHAPGARTTATMLFVTSAQLSRIADGEFNYVLARLDAATIECTVPLVADPLAFVSRHGAIAERGEALDLRTVAQTDALDLAARTAIGPSATARDLVRETVESYAWAVAEARPKLALLAEPLNRTFWDLHPGG